MEFVRLVYYLNRPYPSKTHRFCDYSYCATNDIAAALRFMIGLLGQSEISLHHFLLAVESADRDNDQ